MVVSTQGYTKVIDKPPRRHQLDVIAKHALNGGRGGVRSPQAGTEIQFSHLFWSLIVIKQDFGPEFLY